MPLDHTACHRAICSRDARFDGVFFTAVQTTGIYCRPVCPARTPKAGNCRFFASAAEAEHSGFRPCLRCRPELAPASRRTRADDAAALVLAQIRSGESAETGLAALATQLGITDRHLRRLFVDQYGLPPVAFAQTERLRFAKQLLQETSLSMTDVAYSAGFKSLRRFHALFQSRYGLTPSLMRGKQSKSPEHDVLTLRLSYRPPLAWEEMLQFLAPRMISGVEVVANGTYRRTVSLGDRQGWLEVQQQPGSNGLIARVPSCLSFILRPILSRLRRLFDLDADPVAIAAHLGRERLLAHSLQETPGLRVPGAWDGFELAMRAILGQQVTVKGASTLAGRLTERFGQSIETPFADLSIVSPSAATIAAATVEEIAAVGLPRTRAATLHTLAKAVSEGKLQLDGHADPFSEMETLQGLPGFGDWTVQYVAMRALAWPDAFPAGDLGLRKAFGRGIPVNERILREKSEAWRPWRSYAAMHLWKMLRNV
ncbi:MAG TPA: AlkA N-terminal domain-containing protein [Bryobacteraceae bacterium]|nr:AlkA N-terminal domain-containing protein [Bryobacteraceae bacterium]